MPACPPGQFPQPLKHLQRKIEELEGKKHLPPELVSIVTQVSRLQCEALDSVHFSGCDALPLPQAVLDTLPSPEARAQGAFLLRQEDFPLDFTLTERLVPAILDILGAHAPMLASLRHEVEQALIEDESLLKAACLEALSQGQNASEHTKKPSAATVIGPLAAWEAVHPGSPGFFRFVVRSAVMPSLAVTAKLLSPHHDSTVPWPHGHCPICGGLPLMGRLLEEGGARMHVCSFCSFEYRVPRLGCPFCLAGEGENAEYYASDEEPGYVLDVCSTCNNYIKLADFRDLDRVWMPLLDDLASLALDLYARQMNFTRPTFSAWGF